MDFGPQNTPYDAIGGADAVRGLVDCFYNHMDRDEAFAHIRALHPPALAESRDKLFEFLTGWLGGPPLYAQKRGQPHLRARHMRFPIDERARDQWLACMAKAMDERGIVGDVRRFLDGRLAHLADFMRNQPPAQG